MGSARRAGGAVAPLSTIPTVYFEEDFKLENPRTFDVVSERAEIVRQPGSDGSSITTNGTGKKALAANAILQEKLSWYMDTVEIHLISSISTASTSFFAALGSLRELHAEAQESVKKIKILREDLGKLDENMAVGGLKVVAMKRRRENVRKLGEAIRQLEEIVRLMADCEDQVENGEIEEALKGLSNVETLMAGDADDLPDTAQRQFLYQGNMIDLRGLKALEGASGDIAFLRKRIGKAFETKFIDVLLGDLRGHVDNVPFDSTFQRWNLASSRLRGHQVKTPAELPAYVHIDGAFRSMLHTQLKGLARSDSIMNAAVAYRDAVIREFKNLIRRHLPSSSDDDTESTISIMTTGSTKLSQQEKSSILARNLRALDSADAEEMLKKIYANVGEALRRLGVQVKVLLDITSSLGSPYPNMPLKSPPRSPALGVQTATINGLLSAEPSPGPPPSLIRQDEIQQVLDLSSLLGQAVDTAQAQIIKILKVRSEQTTHLEMQYFLRYFNLNRLFADECEAVSGRGGNALKTVVNDHIKTFVNSTSEAEKQQLVQNMDSDKWDAKDFTDEDSQRLELIITASTRAVEPWIKMLWLWGDDKLDNQQPPNGVTNGTHLDTDQKDSDDAKGKAKARGATLDEEEYIIPASAITVLGGLVVYEQLMQSIPSMSTEISTSMLDYIKLYNSRSSQLILGAGATKSAGLKNITTRHLALSSQALNFITAVIPYLREFARRYLPSSSSMVTEFDDVKRRLQDHRVGIQDKLIEIMTGRSTAHVNKMKEVDWNVSSNAASTYMETLIKETTTLHKVLTRHLPESNVRMIMNPVISNYRDQWGRAYQGVVITSEVGKEK
jgi:vacuolar protein sorting-associated protein 54